MKDTAHEGRRSEHNDAGDTVPERNQPDAIGQNASRQYVSGSRLTLPPRTGGEAEAVDTTGHRSVIVIGANGAGKTRFTNRMCADLGDRAFRLNAIDALYGEGLPDPGHSAIDRLHAASHVPAYDKSRPQSRLERLLTMLMSDELVNLLRHKFIDNPGGNALPATPTRLDRLITFWREVFPENRVLVDSGKILFGRSDSTDIFSAVRLSDGERAVLFYGVAMLYAPEGSVIVVDSPEMFLHPSTMQGVWNRLEQLRPDCTVVYTTHDLEFAASRNDAVYVWVRSCDTSSMTWDYSIIPDGTALTGEVYLSIMGARKPVLFIEGDARSIDARLYPLIFPDFTVRSLGSCNKVIEATRTFNDLNGFHNLQARGIVDRDRRDPGEVDYLRRKNVMVPEVAEIENMLLLPEVITAVAESTGARAERVLSSVRRTILTMFRHDLRSQALQHTRHNVKRTVEYRIDGRFSDIGSLEKHINGLLDEINPRGLYEKFCREFSQIAADGDYLAVLRVYNQKSMLPGCNVAGLCGLSGKDEYISRIMDILRADTRTAASIRAAVRAALLAD